ncbi:MAG: tetratricopeptide repeat protein, partial [Gammaproteobacteria bacterium]
MAGNQAEALRLHREGRLGEAETAYRSVIAQEPDNPVPLHMLGMILHQTGRSEEARAFLERAVDLAPGSAQSWLLLSLATAAAEHPEEAADISRRGLARHPADLPLMRLAARLNHRLGRWTDALDCLQRIRGMMPGEVDAAFEHHFAIALHQCGRLEEAEAAYQRARRLGEDSAALHYNLALLAEARGNFQISRAALDETLKRHPEHLDARLRLANLDAIECRWQDRDRTLIDLSRRLLEWVEDDRGQEISPFLLNTLGLDNEVHDQVIRRHAERVAARAGAPLPSIRSESREILRVGYLSPDLGAHAVGGLIYELFGAHDRTRFRIHVYSQYPWQDRFARRIAETSDVFRDVSTLDARSLAERIRADGIDVLFDLGGYTRHTRPEALALRPAPVQIAWLGYLNTSGAPFIDYLVADEIVVPTGRESRYTEQMLHLPPSFLVASRIADPGAPPPRSELRLPEQGFVFCSFNNTYKIDPAVLAAWQDILRGVPGSVLWLYDGGREGARANLAARMADAGLADRIVFAPMVPMSEHLARLRQADLFLDTFIYNAGATAVTAMRAGLPVLTR